MIELNTELKRYFGFDKFRPGQEEIIKSILSGNDTLAVMPTGGGKSLCYQLPAIISHGTAIVISPLIALMKDQVDSLNRVGVPATFINSSLALEELQTRVSAALQGKYKLLYVAPERLENEFFLKILNQMTISFLAIDEAHCISEWGHDFRPAYLNITTALSKRPIKPIAAFTATAGPQVQEDIQKILGLKQPNRFIKGFDRPNLRYISIEDKNKLENIIKILKKSNQGSSIIYCGSRKKVDEISFQLGKLGFPAAGYHAGLNSELRKNIQDGFITGEKNIIVATNAFGMGIDKPDVRNVIHCDFTGTLEAYYQEAGRAGRDGLQSDCYLIYHNSDIDLQEFFISCRFPEKEDFERIWGTLQYYADSNRKLKLSTTAIGNYASIPDIKVNSILDLMQRENLIEIASKSSKASLKITASRESLIDYYQNTSDERREIINSLMRQLNADVFNRFAELNINDFCRKHSVNEQAFSDTIRAMKLAGMIDFQAEQNTGEISILQSSDSGKLPINYEQIQERKKQARLKLDVVIRYAETPQCKRNFILEYFQDDEIAGECGKCTSCLSTHKTKTQKTKKEYLLKQVLNGLWELDNRFGKILLIQFLRGIANEKTKKYNLAGKEFFGALSDISETEVRQAIDDANFKGYMRISSGLYPILSITNEGLTLISRQKTDMTLLSDNEAQNILYKKLKIIRADIAMREGITERAIASDKALRQIAIEPPKNLSEIYKISGLSRYTADKYGKLLLAAINDEIADETGLEANIEIDPNVSQILNMFEEGKNIDEIAKIMQTDKGTIARDMQSAIMNDKIQADWRLFIAEKEYNKIKQIIYSKPHIALRNLRMSIAVEIDYAILRIVSSIARKNM